VRIIYDRGIAPTKYQPGDVVRIRPDLSRDTDYFNECSGRNDGGCDVVDDMIDQVGQFRTIWCINDYGGIFRYKLLEDEGDRIWTDEMFVDFSSSDEDDGDIIQQELNLTDFLKGGVK
jgi:hypothetical protein